MDATLSSSATRRRMRWLAAVALAALWTVAQAGTALATTATFALTTGSTFNLGSGVAIVTDAGLYPTGTAFPVQISPLPVSGTSSLEVSDYWIPDVEVGAFESEVYAFQLLELGSPADSFALTLDDATGAINLQLADPALEIEMSRTVDGTPSGTELVSVDLTTGDVALPACGSSAARTISGSALDSASGAVKLVGGRCIETFSGSPFGMILEIKLEGVISVPEPSGLTMLFFGLIGLAVLAGRGPLT